jgi:hypothetical protein
LSKITLQPSASVLSYRILIENQQMRHNDRFIVVSSQTLQHVSAYQRHYQGAHMILTRYLYMSVCITRKIMEFRVNYLQSGLLHYGYKWLWLTAVGSSGLLWNTAQGVGAFDYTSQ